MNGPPRLRGGASGVVAWGGEALVSRGSTVVVDCFVARTVDVVDPFRTDKDIKYHLNYQTLRQHRDHLDCRQLILTHMSQDMLGHLSDVEFECAADSKIVVL